ncbi:pectinesterase family protein [Planosporangium sp. 12N6]|uniref:pectinesterase family protein n=1 Tax=Planosporangium spinosum TaxID=3402278 RepID=UPI003CF2F327
MNRSVRLAVAAVAAAVATTLVLPAGTAAAGVTPSGAGRTAGATRPEADRPAGAGVEVTVAGDGTGDYVTVQAAIDAVPTGNPGRVTIRIAPGVYRGPVSVPADKPYLTLRGQGSGPSDVVITDDRASGTPKPGGGTYGTSGSASVTIDGRDFTARNLTFANSFDEAAHPEITNRQAVAVLTRADRLFFDRVRFLGNQDTLYVNSPDVATPARAYFRGCYVEGDVDFIFGRGTAVFDRCEIRSLDRGSDTNNGYVTAASTTDTNPYGFLFVHCALTGDAPAKTVYLGRPWHPSGDPHAIGQVVFRDSWLGAHVKDEPWTDMSGYSWRDARFSEYRTVGPGAAAGPQRPRLTGEQARAYTPRAYLVGADGWRPDREG